MFDLSGRSVLIVGIGTNMGVAAARGMIKQGARVAINDLREEVTSAALSDLRKAAPEHQVVAINGDVRDTADCKRLIDETVGAFGSLDILVSCIGRSSFGKIVEVDQALFEQEIGTNLTGNFLISQAAARQLIAQGRGGRIIIFSSGAGESARRGGVSHCSSKAGVNMLVKVLALELGAYGITVNAVSPGFVPKASTISNDEYHAATLKGIPLGRVGVPEDLSGAVCFLASDEACWITGDILHVDGGSLAGRGSVPLSVSSPRSSF